jgi:hypothetical protein
MGPNHRHPKKRARADKIASESVVRMDLSNSLIFENGGTQDSRKRAAPTSVVHTCNELRPTIEVSEEGLTSYERAHRCGQITT